MRLRSLVCIAILLATALPAHAQDVERSAVLATVQKVFDAMRTRDTALLRQAFDHRVVWSRLNHGFHIRSCPAALEGRTPTEVGACDVVQFDGKRRPLEARERCISGRRREKSRYGPKGRLRVVEVSPAAEPTVAGGRTSETAGGIGRSVQRQHQLSGVLATEELQQCVGKISQATGHDVLARDQPALA